MSIPPFREDNNALDYIVKYVGNMLANQSEGLANYYLQHIIFQMTVPVGSSAE